MGKQLAIPGGLIRFDWKKPDYTAVFRSRLQNLDHIRSHPEVIPELENYYRLFPADFINDWGVTYDPRNADIGLPTIIPFILFKRQRDWVDWVIQQWRGRKPGLCEKSRDMGVSWLALSLSCTLCLFNEAISIGIASRKSEYVDKIGMFKPLLPKGRMFMRYLPEEFRGGWVEWRDAPYMRISFPKTGSLISGEAGDDIGRGDRTTLHFVDETAALPRADLVESSLSQTTNCRIDMSSVRGMDNVFAKKRWSGKVDVFIFDWREDPRKDEAWYKKQQEELDEVVVAQEIDRDYGASVSGIVIPNAWVRAAIDANERLGIAPAGLKGMALDVADEGDDKNAVCRIHGTEILETFEWSGRGADLYATTERCFALCEEHGYAGFRYDADGIGAGIRGDARVLNEARRDDGKRALVVVGYQGSGAVYDPEGFVEGTKGGADDEGRQNLDYYYNLKAQAWWELRRRFYRTHRWITKNIPCNAVDIISISSKCPNHMKLVGELSQATYSTNSAGKMLINKKPKNAKSPNLADAVVIRYARMEQPRMVITPDMVQQIAKAAAPRRRGY